MDNLQDTNIDGLKVNAFPNQPELVWFKGKYYIADAVAIGFGKNPLQYHEVNITIVGPEDGFMEIPPPVGYTTDREGLQDPPE